MAKQGRGYILAKRYRVERKLGAGTSATVFEATDTRTDQRVAVKVVHHLFRKDRTVRKRFLREAEAARALVTPHAVKVLDVGELPQGIPYLVMELLEGATLERMLRRQRGGLGVEQAMGLTDQIAAALQDAHGLDIVHRDLKPENVFVVDAGGEPFVKVVDFGISKLIGGQDISQLTATGVMVGTPVYMAPEQIEGWKDIDGRVDVYSLGVVMFEMLAGASPFATATDFSALLRMLMSEPPDVRTRRPDVPPGLAAMIARAMKPDRNERLPNMESIRLGIAPFWSGRRPSLHSYEAIAPSSDDLSRHASGPDLGELFESRELGSTTRRRTLGDRAVQSTSPAGQGGASRWQQPALPPPVPPPRKVPPPPPPSRRPPPGADGPSRRAPPPPPAAFRKREPASLPPPRPPTDSRRQIVRKPMESGIGSAPSPTSAEQEHTPTAETPPRPAQRRDETDLRWPPRLDDAGDDETR